MENNVTTKTNGKQIAQLLRTLFPYKSDAEWQDVSENQFEVNDLGLLYINRFDELGGATIGDLINAMAVAHINPYFVLYTTYWGKFSLCIANYDKSEIIF